MAFEPQTAGPPLVNPQKKTTRVNILMAVGVAVFLGLCIGFIAWKAKHPGPDAAEHPPATGQPHP